MSKASHTWFLTYGVATISMALGVWIRRLLDPALGEAYPFATLFFAVTVSAWYGGFGPALLAVVLGAILSAYFLVDPRGSLAVHGWDQQVGMALYLSVSFGIALLGGAMRAAQHRAEANMVSERTQREQLRVTLESIGDAVIVTNADGRVRLLNSTAQALTGWHKEQALGQPLEKVFNIFNELTGEAVASPVAKVRQTGAVIGLANHTVLLANNGKHYPIEDSAAPIKDANGTMLGVVLVFRDMSERRKAELALRQAHIELEKRVQERTAELARQAATMREQGEMIELAHDAIIVRDFNGTITSWNRGGEKLYGWSGAEVIGKSIHAVLQTEFPHSLAEVEAELVRNGYWQGILMHKRQDGSRIEVDSRWTLKSDGQEQPARILEINTDITVQKQYERELREKNLELEKANLAKDRFLASMSHELRTPLNAIIGFTGTLLMKLPGPLTADQERQLRTVQTSAQHLLSLINDLLDLAKIESGKLDLTFKRVALAGVVQEVATTLRPLAEGKGLRLAVDMPQPDIVVDADQRAVTQIVLNLVNNAIKFTQEGSVTLALHQHSDGGQVLTEIRVVDTGPGIRPEDQAKLFQAFSQVGSSLQYNQKGTGLGLHLSQKLAELMGASITVKSEKGQGSTFALQWSEG